MTKFLTISLLSLLLASCASVPDRSAQQWLDSIKAGDESAWHTGIQQLASQGATAAPVLARALGSDDKLVRSAAQWALMLMGTEAATAVPDLIKTLERDDRDERWRAVSALGRIGPSSSSSVPVLIQLLNEDVEFWDTSVVWALGQIGPEAHQAIPVLASLLAREDHRGSHIAVREALRRILAI